tara:strand:+ start:308 stop:460 length:153 start_codon:yes stop_codon:yes gene_type:complete
MPQRKKRNTKPYIHPIDQLEDKNQKFDEKVIGIIMLFILALVIWGMFDPD